MKHERNYGIDLLRIVAMLMVTVLHVQGHGGVLEAAIGGAVYWAYLLEAAAYCAVNCYGLISGYVGAGQRWRPAAFLALWCQVAFYSVGLTALDGVLHPGTVGAAELIRAAMPITFQGVDYWYFTAYAGVFFMMPLLNHILRTMPPRRLLGGCLVLVAGFSLLPTLLRQDVFVLREGYTALWLAVLYLVGGCCKQCGLLAGRKPRTLLLVYAGAVLLSWGQPFVRDFLNDRLPLYAKLGERILEADANWLSYTSPTVLAAAVALLVLFAGMSLPPLLQKVTAFAAPLSFSVYLIQNHPAVLASLMKGRFAAYAALPGPLLIPAVVGTAAGIYLVCLLLDALRAALFRAVHLKAGCALLESLLRRGFDTVLNAAERL